MIRNIKVLGLALIAVFAVGAVMASSTFAAAEQGELTSDGSVKITGTDIVGQKTIISISGDKITCHGHYLAEVVVSASAQASAASATWQA